MGEIKENWIVKHSESKDAFNIIDTKIGGKYKIARVPYLVTETMENVNKREKTEAEQHAKLIASAPEMLEALIKCCSVLKKGNTVNIQEIELLIKKATE